MNICIVAQQGRVLYQALLFAYSFDRACVSDARLYICVPKNSYRWETDPTVRDKAALGFFRDLGAKIVYFRNEHFGSKYPHSNKIYAIGELPREEPFIFFDSDVVLIDDIAEVNIDFSRPSGVHGGVTWPRFPEREHDERDFIWRDLYRHLGVDIRKSLNPRYNPGHFMHYMYFNGGFVYADCPHQFHTSWLDNALRTREYLKANKSELTPIYPWLDQVALGVTCAQFGGRHGGVPKDTIDERYSYHYHFVPALYAPGREEALKIAKAAKKDPEVGPLLKGWEAFQTFISDEWEDKIAALIEKEGVTDRNEMVQALKAHKLAKK